MEAAPPLLFDLCKQGISLLILQDAAKRQELLSMPLDMVQCVLPVLTPFALEHLHRELEKHTSNLDSGLAVPTNECTSLKRSFADMAFGALLSSFDNAWKCKFHRKWPLGVKWPKYKGILSSTEMELLGVGSKKDENVDWRQRFWESFVQECLNEAAAQASTPTYQGLIGDIVLSDSLLQQVGMGENSGSDSISHVCELFSQHARYLRLRGALLTEQLIRLLIPSKLHYVALAHITNKAQLDAACMLVAQSKENLRVLELRHCRYPQGSFGKLHECISTNDGGIYQLQHLFIVSSRNLFETEEALSQFGKFLHVGRYLESIVLTDNQVSHMAASNIFCAIFNSIPHLCVLRLTENELEGFNTCKKLAMIPCMCSHAVQKHDRVILRALDLRSNKFCASSMQGIAPCLTQMFVLEHINLSDNSIGDDGLRAIVPCLQALPLLELGLSKCSLSSIGVSFLFVTLMSRKVPIKSLNLSHNSLGSSIAIPLADFLESGAIERLEIADVELGCDGCLILQKELKQFPRLVHIDLSLNRLGIAGCSLISKLIMEGSALKSIDCSWNLLTLHHVKAIAASVLQRGLGRSLLELLDLRHNLASASFDELDQIRAVGKPTILISDLAASCSYYHDDDP